ncbi:MAG: DUF1800 family protein [Pseudomonadota bacterium]
MAAIALAATAGFGSFTNTVQAQSQQPSPEAVSNFIRFIQALLERLEALGVDVDALIAERRAQQEADATRPPQSSPGDGSSNASKPSAAAMNSASRFLSQAGMGGSYQDITQVAQMGEAAWLEQQFAMAPGYTMPLMEEWRVQFIALYGDGEEFESEEDDVENDESCDREDDEDSEISEDDTDDEIDTDADDAGDEDEGVEDSVEGDEGEDDAEGEDGENDERCIEPLSLYDFESNSADFAWYQRVVHSEDTVRQRVATSLSQLFVISRVTEEVAEHSELRGSYYDMLLRNSFGNFRNLLLDVTLHPGMGLFLSHVNNAKSNPELGTFPDENYAREVMQLFTIGLYELNLDGSRRLDSNGVPIPTYDNNDIREFAKIFTGLTFNGPNPVFSNRPEPEGREADFGLPMIMVEQYHEPGEKRLLNGTVVPAGQSGMQDIEAAVDNLFNHPNVGPFVGKQLIQRLVTSNPSPGYVARVAAAFNGEGGTPRGDMKALLRAILLDEEARQDPSMNDNAVGKLREPMLRHIHILRAFDASSSAGTVVGYAGIYEEIGQFLFSSPSVFNFFQPSFSPNGELRDAGLVAPEFQITTTDSIVAITNMVNNMTFGEEVTSYDGAISFLGRADLQLDREIFFSINVPALVDMLDTVLTYGTLRPDTRDVIIAAVEQAESPRERVYRAIYLITISPDYAISL